MTADRADTTSAPASTADLRELLIASERKRAVAEQAREQAEIVLAGLDIIATARDDAELFDGMLAVVREVVPFEAAAVLVEMPDGDLDVVVSTDADLPIDRLEHDDFVERVLAGAPATVFDLGLLPTWQPVAEHGSAHRSGLFVPLRATDGRAIFLCLADETGVYSRRQLEIIQYLAPLAGQALQRHRDMSELDRLIGRLDRLAHQDSLTGLANRTVFANELQAAIMSFERTGHPVAILHLDLDDFKVVNDTLGHEAGDELIRTVADRIAEATRGADAVARLGGDEFAILLSGVSRTSQAEVVAGRVIERVNVPVHIDGHEIRPNASIGISICPHDEADPRDLLASADIALYDAKAAGGGRAVRFSPTMREQREHTRRVETAIRGALAADQFVLYYQPIYPVGACEPTGYEALIRWEHPTRGLLPPGDFIPIAEQSGLIVDIGTWVLERALVETADWLRERHGRRVSVNVAARQILAPDFVEQVLTRVDARELHPSSLELELSEEIVGRRTVDTMLSGLGRLDRAGVRLAFDDFGTGYSSVQQLRTFPGHRLKIDRQFVSRLEDNVADRAVVGGMIDLARGMGLTVVAEGIESSLQCEYIRALGGAELQGFFLGRPAPWSTALARAFPAQAS